MFRRLSAPSTPFYTPNVLHVDYSDVTIPANRKTQSFKFRRTLCYFVPDLSYHGIQTLFPLHPTRRLYYMSISVSKHSLQIAKRNLSNCEENLFISFRMEILRRSYALSSLFYTPNVLHVDFSVETIPANRKTQSFKFRRKHFYFVPDWDTTAFKRSFLSIPHAEPIACRFQCRNNACKSQNAIIQISTKTLLFRSILRYYGI
jgi:hypothetical protein